MTENQPMMDMLFEVGMKKIINIAGSIFGPYSIAILCNRTLFTWKYIFIWKLLVFKPVHWQISTSFLKDVKQQNSFKISYQLHSFILHRKHQSETACKTESFDSFFCPWDDTLGLKWVTLVPVCHLTDKKWVKWLSFTYCLTLIFSV